MPPLNEETFQTSDSSLKMVHGDCDSSTIGERNRKVSFAQSVGVQEIKHLKDMDEEECRATWYFAEDYENIKASMVVTVRLMMAKKPVSDDQCTRGLEHRTPAGSRLRKKKKIDAITAVWNEQVSQWENGIFDEARIAAVYEPFAAESREEALRYGLLDQDAVQNERRRGEYMQRHAHAVSPLVGTGICQAAPRRSSCAPSAA